MLAVPSLYFLFLGGGKAAMRPSVGGWLAGCAVMGQPVPALQGWG